jgi:hypothetical protein
VQSLSVLTLASSAKVHPILLSASHPYASAKEAYTVNVARKRIGQLLNHPEIVANNALYVSALFVAANRERGDVNTPL